MGYFNIKEMIANPQKYKKELEELKSYPYYRLFMKLEIYMRKKYSERMMEEKLEEQGYGRIEIEMGIREYKEYIIKNENYRLSI